MPAYDTGLFAPPAPVAHVRLRNPGTGHVASDVPMLIDSGADVTLLPRVFVIEAGISIVDGVGYELVGFDGSRSLAPSVRADLLFESFTFKGQFLVVDQPWGIIGRDILNRVCLTLNGRQSEWVVS